MFFIVSSIFLIEHRGYHPDEAFRKLLSDEDNKAIWTIDTHPPLYMYLLKLGTLHVMRYVTLLISLFGLFMTYRISRMLHMNPMLGVVLYSTHVQILNYSSFALSTIPATVFALIGFYFYLKREYMNFYIFSFFGAGMNVIAAVSVFSIFLYELTIKRRWNWAVFGTGIMCAVWFINLFNNNQYIDWLNSPTLTSVLWSMTLAAGGFMAFFIMHVLLIVHRKNLPYKLIYQWLVPFIVLIVTSFLFTPIMHDRYLVIVVPFGILLLSKLMTYQRPLTQYVLLSVIVITGVMFYPALIDPSYREVMIVNQYIDNGVVLHHSMMSLHPSMIYTPNAHHYLDLRNYTISAPLIQSHSYGDTNDLTYIDYELQATGQPTVLQRQLFEYKGLRLMVK